MRGKQTNCNNSTHQGCICGIYLSWSALTCNHVSSFSGLIRWNYFIGFRRFRPTNECRCGSNYGIFYTTNTSRWCGVFSIDCFVRGRHNLAIIVFVHCLDSRRLKKRNDSIKIICQSEASSPRMDFCLFSAVHFAVFRRGITSRWGRTRQLQ